MDIIKKFNLPSYVKGKSFAQASAFIAKKFEGRTDPESIATLNELQGRLKQAQEFVKAEKAKMQAPQQDPNQPAQPPMEMGDENLFEDGGGLLSGLLGKITPGAGAVTSGLDMLGGLLSGEKTGAVDIAGGAAKTALGLIPGGSLASPLVDLATGLINKKNPAELTSDSDMAKNYQATMMEDGGYTDPTDPTDPPTKTYDDYLKELQLGVDKTVQELIAKERNIGNVVDSGMQDQGLTELTTNNPFRPKVAGQTVGATKPGLLDYSSENFGKMLDVAANPTQFTSSPTQSANSQDSNQDKTQEQFNPLGALRYAPTAMNAVQLGLLKRPDDISLSRNNAVYNKNRIDERGIQNTVEEGVKTLQNQIVQSGGGSGAANRANLLATSLQGSKALSDAYMNAQQMNNRENTIKQQFDNQNRNVNLQQGNAETQINLTRDAAFETNRSQLLSALGNDAGNIGKEELLKRFPELMGLSYDWKGRKIKPKKSSN